MEVSSPALLARSVCVTSNTASIPFSFFSACILFSCSRVGGCSKACVIPFILAVACLKEFSTVHTHLLAYDCTTTYACLSPKIRIPAAIGLNMYNRNIGEGVHDFWQK